MVARQNIPIDFNQLIQAQNLASAEDKIFDAIACTDAADLGRTLPNITISARKFDLRRFLRGGKRLQHIMKRAADWHIGVRRCRHSDDRIARGRVCSLRFFSNNHIQAVKLASCVHIK